MLAECNAGQWDSPAANSIFLKNTFLRLRQKSVHVQILVVVYGGDDIVLCYGPTVKKKWIYSAPFSTNIDIVIVYYLYYSCKTVNTSSDLVQGYYIQLYCIKLFMTLGPPCVIIGQNSTISSDLLHLLHIECCYRFKTSIIFSPEVLPV